MRKEALRILNEGDPQPDLGLDYLRCAEFARRRSGGSPGEVLSLLRQSPGLGLQAKVMDRRGCRPWTQESLRPTRTPPAHSGVRGCGRRPLQPHPAGEPTRQTQHGKGFLALILKSKASKRCQLVPLCSNAVSETLQGNLTDENTHPPRTLP